MSNFTAGPWEAESVANAEGGITIFPTDSGAPVAVAVYRGGVEPARINANLIAAAPEMHKALNAFLQLPHLFDDVCDRGTDCKVCKAILLGTAALAKADGGQQ